MTPQEFYDGPAKKLLELAAAKKAFSPISPRNIHSLFRAADASWERVCRYCRRPSSKSCDVYEDLAAVVASLLLLGDLVGTDVLARADAIMKPKMVDYADEADFAANFKRSAQRAGVSPARAWAIFASKHFDAVAAYVRNGKTESEAIEDRLADLVNYCELLAGMVAVGEA